MRPKLLKWKKKLQKLPETTRTPKISEPEMSEALFRNVAADTARLIRRNAAAAATEPFGKTTVAQSRPYFRSPQLLGKAKETGVSAPSPSLGFCSSSSASISKVGFVGWYLGMVKSRPVVTKSVTSSLIYIAADLSSQTIAKTSSESYDLVRTARMAGYGLFVLGPILHYWFNFMSRLFPQRDLITTFKKMAMGQAIYGPTMTVIFFSLNASLQGESGSDILARLKRDLLPAMFNGVMYWPLCDFITFRFFHVHLQDSLTHSALGKQLVFVCMDNLHDLHGKP